MSEYSNESQQRTIGLDVGDQSSYYVVLDRDGEVIEEGRVRTRQRALEKKFGQWEPSRVALEVGTHSRWVSQLLRGLGHEAVVANARRLRLISQSDRKTDRMDAELLARLARVDVKLLCPIQHRSARVQADLQGVRSRAQLVKVRAQLIQHVRSSVKSAGGRLPRSSSAAFSRSVADQLPGELQESLSPVVQLIGQLSEQIRGYDRRIEQRCQHEYPETGVVRQIRGVGPVTALTFVLTLQEAGRFRDSRQVGAYVGLCPRRDQSGQRDPQLRITKAGDRMLRRLLVQCAHYILGPFGSDSDLRRHGEKIAARGGQNAKKRAVVAVARKLAVLGHHLWVTGEVYEPLYNAQRRAA